MKELYFTIDNLEAKAKAMLAKCNRSRFPKSLDINHCALLLIDLQAYFLDQKSTAFIPSSEAIVPRLLQLSSVWQEAGLKQICTRHIDSEEQPSEMTRWWKKSLPENDPYNQLISEFDDSLSPVIVKKHYDVFMDTALEAMLKESDITQLLIGGLKTNLCCETTARSAFMRGFDVFFLVDGTATNNQSYHEASLLNLSYGFATLVLTGDILKSLKP